MEQDQLIPVDIICTHHKIEYTFIDSLNAAGLIEVSSMEGRQFVHPSQLNELEKFICFHYDLDINLEGIEAIANILQKLQSMQDEISVLKSKLRNIDHSSSLHPG
ncbi:MAG TPA: chaperone modulator CbpM [Chitinophagaceae bacterium]